MIILAGQSTAFLNVIQTFVFSLIFAALVSSFVFAFIAFFWSNELKKYIQNKYPERWRELASQFQIPFIKFQMTTETSEDPVINLYRSRYQKYSKIWKISMFAVIVGLGLIRLIGWC